MVLSFYGQHSPRINATAVLGKSDESTASLASGLAVGESVEAKLEAIRPLDGVAVTAENSSVTGWHGRSPLCAPASVGGALTRIRFDEHGGDVPPLGIVAAVYGRDNTTGAIAAASISLFHDGQLGSVRGTTERATCSDRGICNHLTGDCLCFANYFASNGDGASGFRPDCGYASVNVTDCPNGIDRCSTRGVCDHQRVINGSLFEVDTFASFVNESFLYKCSCYSGYHGGDCSLQICPSAAAWFDEASSDNVAHAIAECSAMGHCDTSTGECRCRDGFTGEACERMACPIGQNGKECNSKGRCLTLKQAAASTVRHGFRPGTDEVQAITCSLVDTTFFLELNHHRTFAISSNASAAAVRSLIEELPSVGLVSVTLNPGPVACLSTGNVMVITFTNHDSDTEQFIATSPEGVANAGLSVSTVSDSSRLTYGETPGVVDTWDADKLALCDCDGRPDYNKTRPSTGTYSNYTFSENYVGYTGAGLASEVDLGLFEGPTCERRPCPAGPDPLNSTTSLGVLESQAITCTAPSVVGGNVSSVVLVHMGVSTTPLSFNSTVDDVRLALERLASIGRVSVNMTQTAFCTSGGTVTNVTFLTEFGDLPLMRYVITDGQAVAVSVSESIKGTRHNVECNERGVCDSATGLCNCFDGFVSGNGAHGQGRRGDCGGMDDLYRDGA